MKYTSNNIKQINKNISGIYKLTNIINNKFYYGQTICFQTRFKNHYKQLRTQKHENEFILNDFKKTGSNIENIIFEIVELCSVNRLDETENVYLTKYYDNKVNCYNIAKEAESFWRGQKHSEESKKKMSISQSGKNNAMFGKTHSQETREKLSEMNKGKFCGSENPFFGKTHSQETREKLSALTKQQWENFSDEHKEKLKSLAAKKYVLINIITNEKFVVVNLHDWCKKNFINYKKLYRTHNTIKNINNFRLLDKIS